MLSPEEMNSVDAFCSLDDDTVLEANKYFHRYGKEEGNSVEWKIYGDTEYINTLYLVTPFTATR